LALEFRGVEPEGGSIIATKRLACKSLAQLCFRSVTEADCDILKLATEYQEKVFEETQLPHYFCNLKTVIRDVLLARAAYLPKTMKKKAKANRFGTYLFGNEAEICADAYRLSYQDAPDVFE
jgi:hypothetical protein